MPENYDADERERGLTLEAENRELRSLLERVGTALETIMLEWDGTIADSKLTDAYQGLKAYRAWRR